MPYMQTPSDGRLETIVERLELLAAEAAVDVADADTGLALRGLTADELGLERRDFTGAARTRFDAIARDLAEARANAGIPAQRVDNGLEHRVRDERREQRALEARQVNRAYDQVARVSSEPTTYRKGDPSTSYFRDLYEARTRGDSQAVDRLVRNDKERRAISNTGQTSTIGAGGGAGGEFAPPAWLVDQYVRLARPGRPTADLLNPQPLPAGVANVNLPKVTTGSLTGVQSTQNTALASQDMVTSSVSSSITTIGGKMVVSQQLLDQAGVNLDEVIMTDLAADYAKQLDAQVLSGTGASGQLAGILGVSGINTVTYTDASPAVAGSGKLYAQLAKAKQAVDVTRYAPITAWVMHPNRWAWMVASFDTQNRPLFLSEAYNPMNAAGVIDRVASQSVVGSLHGLPVIIDAQVPTTLNTNQDVIIGARWEDIYLYESEPRVEAFQATYADSLGVLVRLYNYVAMIPNRQPKAIVTIGGTGNSSTGLAYPPTY